MNLIIEKCNNLPFSRLDNIFSTVLSTWILYAIIITTCFWLFNKTKLMFKTALFFLLAFTILQVVTSFKTYHQTKMIVYNVPGKSAVDFVLGNKFVFYGDSILKLDGLLQKFHLRPSRISMHLDKSEQKLKGLQYQHNFWLFFGKKIMMIDTTVFHAQPSNRIKVDVLIISKDPKMDISSITSAILPSVILFDSSNSLWKIAKWKKECLALALPCFSIPEQGAFVLNIDQ